MPDSENALDTSYFHSRYSWNYSYEQCFPTNKNEDCSDGDSLSGSSGRLSSHHDEGVLYADPLSFLRNIGVEFRCVMSLNINVGTQVDICHGPAEFETGVSEDYPFNNFSFKVLYHDFPHKIPCPSKYTINHSLIQL